MVELKLPELGENIEVVDVSAILVSVGDSVRRDQPVIEVETEKASLEVPSLWDGKISQLKVQPGDKLKVGEVILEIETSDGVTERVSVQETPVEAAEPAAPEAAPKSPDADVVHFPSPPAATTDSRPQIGPTAPAAPSVRALARELGIDIHQVPGSGPGGRISRDDVKKCAKSLLTGMASQGGAASPQPAPALPDFEQWGAVRAEPLSNIRRATARNMANSWSQIPHVTQFDRADITVLETMRKRFNQRLAPGGTKLTMTAIVLKMVAGALQRHPKFNASLDLAGSRVILKEYVNIGVAVDTDRGLLVPVLRDVDKKGLPQVAQELNDLAERARAKKIRPEELSGASFTVSNLGGLGTTYFSPIVNWPEVAILGVGRAEDHAVMHEGQFQPRRMMPLSVSYDHRLIDGADAARFLRWIAEALEQPLLLLMQDPAI